MSQACCKLVVCGKVAPCKSALRKPRRRRQRQLRQTKDLTSRTIAVLVRYNSLYMKISKGKMTSAEALTSLQWVPLHARRFEHRCCLVQDAMKGEIPEHLDVFKSTMSQQHGYNTHNGYLPVINKTRTEWGKNKTYYITIIP